MAKISNPANVNLISNNSAEGLSEVQQIIEKQAKLDLFRTLLEDLDKRKFTDIATTISEVKELEKDSTKEIEYGDPKKIDYKTLKDKDPYKNIFESYKDSDADEKEKMYMEIAERIILDRGGVVAYKDGDSVGNNEITQDFVEKEYKILNDEYEKKLDFFVLKDKDGKLYIIKWNDSELRSIKKRKNKIKDEMLENLFSENKSKDEKIEDLKKKLGENTDNPDEKEEKKDEKEEKKDEKKEKPEDKKENPEDKKENPDEKKDELEEDKEKEEFLRKLREYCPWLFEGQDKDKKDDTEKKEENKESVEENPLYVSRVDVEQSILQSRGSSDFPAGTIEIKGTSVILEEFDFYGEMKQEYILAKGDNVKLQQLDKELAELVILCSPKGVPVEQRYQIKLTDEEIAEGGLIVNPARLARYGLAVDYFEYSTTVIEREYKEKIENIEKIETEISELTKIIAELTTKINIETNSSETIAEEIRVKKERLKLLIDRQYVLLLSLKKGGDEGNDKPDEDLLALKDLEKRLMDELDRLKKQKEHQDEVNNRIKELKEKMFDKTSWNELRGLYTERIATKKLLNKLEAEERDLAEDEEKALKALEPLASEFTPGEISKLYSEYYDIQEKHKAKLKEIEDAKNKIAEIEKNIENNGSFKKWQEIESVLDAIPKGKKESIYLITKDGKKCYLEKNGDFYHVMQNPTELFDNISAVNKEELLIALDPDYITKIVIGEENIKQTEILLGNSKEDEEELARLLKEQEGFDKDIDKKIADKEKELADVREKIKNKESKRVIVEKFDDGDKGVYFHDFCERNGIRRKDGKEISWKGGMDTSAIYVDKDGRELKLEWITGASDDGYDNPVTYYELVYYEGTESKGEGTTKIEEELLAIIKEQEQLYMELEELEQKLRIEKSESVKIEIEKQIKLIQEKLLLISQEIKNFSNTTTSFKETIKQQRYGVYKVRQMPIVIPPIPPVIPSQPFEMTASISDMGTDVFREKAALKVEEDLKAYYKSLGRWQVGSRLALFLGRGRKRKKMIKKEMNNMANTAFQTDAGYSALNEQSQNAADRHEHELTTGMEAINKISTVHNQQVDQLCKDYLNNLVNDDQFQQQFNQIIANDASIQNILNGQNITHIGTNVLLRLQEQKALNQLILDMDAQMTAYFNTGNIVHVDNMRNFVSKYIKDYQKTPAFMANFEQFVGGNLNARNQLRQYLNHQKAVIQMQITNLRMNMDILNKGKSAYQINNKDREQGKGSWKYKLGHFMDKHPRGTAIASTAISLGIGLGTGLIASPVLAGAMSLGLFGGLVGTTNAVKKWTHHTKEQNTHEKNMVTDYRNEQAKIQAWQNEALHGHGRKKYKAKRQLALYDQTTQENIKLSDQITEYITDLSAKVGPLTADEENFMKCNLIEGWARLKYYRQMGHNFLASEQVDSTEKDMKRLEKAITLGLQKIGKTTTDIEQNMTATNSLGTNITYGVIQNDLKTSYDKSLIQFKRERRNLSLKYGIGTAALSIGVGAAMQWATGTGIFAKNTPATPATTTSHSGGTDNFALGKDEVLLPGETGYVANPAGIHDSTVSAITGAPSGSTVTFTYGVGTDATPVMAGHLTSADLTSKLSDVTSNISSMSGLSSAQKNAFLSELSSISHAGFNNNNLATMRAAEYLEHCARAMSDVGDTSLIPAFAKTLDVSGGTYNNLAERFMTGAIDVTTPGTPGIPGKTRGRWLMGMPLFFNTFKDRKSSKDTTDQNRGKGNNKQQPKKNQQTP